MSEHPFDNEFRITSEQRMQFQRDGFVKLPGFLNAAVVAALQHRIEAEMRGATGHNSTTGSHFSRVKYDFETDMNDVFELLERGYFRQALTGLSERDLFFTFELFFEIEKGVNPGLPWHVGMQSFGFQPADEFACTLWAPLQPVRARGQRGGMAYVSQQVVEGSFIFDQIEPAVVSTLRAKESAGVRTDVQEYFDLRNGILNSPAMMEILERHQVEEDFEPGDVLLFNKFVVHRSIMLEEEGELFRRAAYVFRFVDATSHYDLGRVRMLEFPMEQYGKGLFAYKPVTRQHLDIANAGAADGDLLADCAYFGDRDRRMLRRDQSPGAA